MFEIVFIMTQGDPICVRTITGYRKSAESIVDIDSKQSFTYNIEGMNSKLNPYYIVGLVDGEGCFCVSFNKHKNDRKLEIRLLFEIELREDDKEILERVKETLDCGNIYYLNYKRYKKWRPHYKYKVSNLKDITTKVIPFFQQYPLQAKKKHEFTLFCKVAALLLAKRHLTLEGIEEIQSLKEDAIRDSLDAGNPHVQWGVK